MKCTVKRGRRRVTCKVKLGKAKRGRLVRAGKTVARGRVANGRVTLVSRAPLAKGTYTLVAGKTSLRVKLR